MLMAMDVSGRKIREQLSQKLPDHDVQITPMVMIEFTPCRAVLIDGMRMRTVVNQELMQDISVTTRLNEYLEDVAESLRQELKRSVK